MFKKIVLSAAVLLPVAVQVVLIAALQNGGTELFLEVWRSFGVQVPEYTQFVYRTIAAWWVGPLVCVTLWALALHRGSRGLAATSVLVSVAIAAALGWSSYAPHLLVRLA